MVIDDFYFMGISIFPDETNAPLVVYADTVPPGSIPLEGFQSVGGWDPQVIQAFRLIESDQFSQGRALKIRRHFSGRVALPNLFGLLRAERLYHRLNL
jgi:hypothetical protein